jgi:hypothetical protein
MGAEAEGEFVRPQRSADFAPGPFPTASGDPPPSAAPEMCRQIRVVFDKQEERQVQVMQNLRLVRRQTIGGDFHGIRCRNDQGIADAKPPPSPGETQGQAVILDKDPLVAPAAQQQYHAADQEIARREPDRAHERAERIGQQPRCRSRGPRPIRLLSPTTKVPGADHHVDAEAFHLDSLAAERSLDRVDLIKMDVEGHEGQVIDGASATLARCRPALVIETGHEAEGDRRAIHDRLRGLGYWMLGIFLDYGMAETDWDAYVAIETPFRSGEAHNLLLAPEEVTALPSLVV